MFDAGTRRTRSAVSLPKWLELCRRHQVKPIPEGDAVFRYAASVGITDELLRLQWAEFKRRRAVARKRQKDWPQTFRNSVEGNWYRLWFLRADGGEAELTTQGVQAQRAAQAAQAEQEGGAA